MKTTKESGTDKTASEKANRFEWRTAVDSAVGTVSERTGLKESTVKAGLLFCAGLAAGLLLRSRR